MFTSRAKYHKLKYGTELNQGDMKPPSYDSGKSTEAHAVFTLHLFTPNHCWDLIPWVTWPFEMFLTHFLTFLTVLKYKHTYLNISVVFIFFARLFSHLVFLFILSKPKSTYKSESNLLYLLSYWANETDSDLKTLNYVFEKNKTNWNKDIWLYLTFIALNLVRRAIDINGCCIF